ncbi:hypothetical protein CC86DRAFT_449709 [Ophiobolus disseminans]|uniref:GDP/GTP exchange factor Sec2 N-terminal domain-containing protein n=1 Tax=Ophiobolus disseminans TaxID=1469910 RepID=A0A6A6ZHD5_9PLEO|nr:hypothetical protein CC86DRAFT_449709 [Ophiobolus disseminans]
MNMAEYAFITHSTAPWVNHGSGSMTPSRLRSLSPMPKEVTRSISVPQLGRVAHSQSQAQSQSESDGMNTIPDPRSATPQPAISRQHSTDSQQPDLGQEVSMLSTKLINAINHSTMLDDSLQQTRHELEAAREQLARVETKVQDHENKVARGLLMDKVVYDKMEKQLGIELQEERNRRIAAENAKRKTDSEVEALTAALFEEANVMVAAARKETEASEKRGEHFKQQIADAEVLQHSLQEQLQHLKGVVETMSAHGDDNESTLATTTAPSTPGITPADKMTKLLEAVNLTPNTPGTDDFSPEHPLHFSHLIHPVLRSDLASFNEFQDMLKISSRSSAPASRVSSGSYGSLNVLGLGSLTNNSSSSLPGSMKSPTSAGNNSPRESIGGIGMPNLKDERFYKRALAEDIEPTLRLDIAPGLSWMARRTVINSITAGSLVVEPHPPSTSRWINPVFPCSLCGEARKGDQYARKYRFKPADTEDSQRYPLCDWCLGRVRATCDYIGFLRMVAAGHWRAETEDEQKNAWEESVRLRERMFWTRVGGGVVPSFIPLRDSPTSPTYTNGAPKPDEEKQTEESEIVLEPVDISVDGPVADRKSEDDPFRSKSEDKIKRVSIGNTIISSDRDSTQTLKQEMDATAPSTPDEAQQPPKAVEEEKATASPSEDKTLALTQDEEKKIEDQAEQQLHNEVRKSIEVKKSILDKPQLQRQRSTSTPPILPMRKKDERLSLQIPGSFDA